jgi:hypothetical protein
MGIMVSGRKVKMKCSFLKKRTKKLLSVFLGLHFFQNKSLFASFSSEKEDSFLGLA